MGAVRLAGLLTVPVLWYRYRGGRLNVTGSNEHLPAFLDTLACGNASRIHSFNSLITIPHVIFLQE